MTWTAELVRKLPRKTLISYIIEVLGRMGFKNYERVSDRSKWGIDIVAIRDDPIAGMEKLIIKVHTDSLASAKDINVFGDLLDKYKADRGILVAPIGFTKDARSTVAKEYRGRIVMWDADKLAVTFSNYGLEAPKIEDEKEEEEEKSPLEEFELDAPLLHEFSPDEIIRLIAKKASAEYPVKPAELRIKSMKVVLTSAYILSWSVDEKNERDKAVVFSKEKVVPKALSSELATPVKKALLNDSSTIKATEREIINQISPSESVIILKERLAKELGVTEGQVRIQDRKKVYVPESVEVELQVGENEGKARVNPVTGEVEFEMKPLPEEFFEEKVREIVENRIGESPETMELTREGWKVKVTGKTKRFTFEFKFNAYTGKILIAETVLTDEALKELLTRTYPEGEILSLEKGKKVAVADVKLKDGIAVVEVNLENGSLKEVRKLPSPEDALDNARRVIEENFPLRNLEMKESRVIEHKFLELELEGEDGKALVKVDGATRDVLDYIVEITPEKAKELVKERYPDFEVRGVEEKEASYLVTAENERHTINVKVSKDGKLIEETDRVLREDVAREIAVEKVKKIDETAELKSLRLENDWVAEFQGGTKVGRLVLDRKTGEVKEEDVRFTEVALENSFHEHIRKIYGETELRTERLTHYKEQNYIHIKVAGKDHLYYARIDTRTGKIISEDRAPAKGLTAKLKQLQLESKYK
ncbi:restriction endonuclease [Thermococcus sp.]|uniref:restriction endonuclease n=2 Tax=Thermococcus sp. TaxID=35749 RepID=UPI00260C1EC5|nr:restriction endonuclease [Thermococcus sp.]